MTLWFVLGTAAELIKVYPLLRAAEARKWDWRVVSTGQSGNNFWRQYDNFSLPRTKAHTLSAADADLKDSTQAGKWFFKALLQSPRPLLKGAPLPPPNWVVVHGDTLSTLIGAIWAKRLRWPVAHVEAGLRSNSWWQPFPEEICRRLVSRLSDLHFAPDTTACHNLRSVKGVVVNTHGNSLIDAVQMEPATDSKHEDKPRCLVNLHRFENLNSLSRWKIMIETTLKAAQQYQVVFVMHPQTEHKINQSPDDKKRLEEAKVQLVPRMMFADFIRLVKQSAFLISDGGSNQEETYYLGVPCLLMRETTERREGLDSTAVLSGFDPTIIDNFLKNPHQYRRPPVINSTSPSQIMLNNIQTQSLEILHE